MTVVETPGERVRGPVRGQRCRSRGRPISALAGGEPFRCWPRQGQYWLLDRELGRRFAKVVGGVPTPVTRGIYCVPTTNRSLLFGADRRRPRGSRRPAPMTGDARAGFRGRPGAGAGRSAASTRSRRSRPTVRRPTPATGSSPTERVELIHAAGIRSTGVSSSPAVAERCTSCWRPPGLRSRRTARGGDGAGADSAAAQPPPPAGADRAAIRATARSCAPASR